MIWESRGQRTLFGPRGVSGLVNVEITPELCVRLASAYATTLKKGSVVTTSRDVSRAARALKRAVHGALNASAINVVDLEAQPLPVARFETARSECSGGIAMRTTPGDPQSIDIIFLDEHGADLSQAAAAQARAGVLPAGVPARVPRRDRRADLPAAGRSRPTPRDLLRCVDMSGVRDAELKVVVDCAGGTASLVLPGLLGRIGVDVLTVNNRLDEATPTQSLAQVRADLHRLAELVYSSRAAFGVRFDPVGERIMLVDDKGALVSDDRALLVVLDLVAAERRPGRVALPGDHHQGGRGGLPVPRRRGRAGRPPRRTACTRRRPRDDVIFAADGRGGFVVPEFSRSIDGIAAFARLLGPGRQDQADAQPDPRQDPGRAPAQAVSADPVGGQGQRDADHRGGGRRARRSTPPTASG